MQGPLAAFFRTINFKKVYYEVFYQNTNHWKLSPYMDKKA